LKIVFNPFSNLGLTPQGQQPGSLEKQAKLLFGFKKQHIFYKK